MKSCIFIRNCLHSPKSFSISIQISALFTESEESVRVAKSAKTRAFEAFEANVSKLRNAMKTNDHSSLMNEFESLTKAMIKSSKVFDANGGIPRFLVRMLCDLEDHVAKSLSDKASFKKLKPAQGRALNRMKLSLKKFCEQYRGIMDEYRKNPVVSEKEDNSSSSSSNSSSESDEESDSGSDSSSSSSSNSSSSSSGKKKKGAKADSDSDSDSVSSQHGRLGKVTVNESALDFLVSDVCH